MKLFSDCLQLVIILTAAFSGPPKKQTFMFVRELPFSSVPCNISCVNSNDMLLPTCTLVAYETQSSIKYEVYLPSNLI